MKLFYLFVFVLLLCSVMASKQTSLYNNAVVNYFGNMSSGNVLDNVASKNMIVQSGTLTYGITGKYGTGFAIDSTDSIKTGSASRLQFNTTKWTLCYWQRRTNNATGEIFQSFDNNAAHGKTEIWYNHAGTYPMSWHHYSDAGTASTWRYDDWRSVGGWAHYCWLVYWNGTDSVKLYKNNVQQTIVVGGTSPKNSPYNMTRWGFGNFSGANSVSSQLQHITFFNATLTAEQIDWLYANGTPTANNVYPFAGSGSPAPVITISYPNATRHYNALNYNGSIVLSSNILANCTLNDANWQLHKNTAFVHTFRNVTNLASSNYTISFFCNSTGNKWTNSSFWFIVDKVKPLISQTAPANRSFINSNFALNLSFYDTYLYWANTTIKTSGGTVKYNKYSGNLNTTHVSLYRWQKQINISGWTDGNYSIFSEARDTHTLDAWNMELKATETILPQKEATQLMGKVEDIEGGGVLPAAELSQVMTYDLNGSEFSMIYPESVTIETSKAVDRFRFEYISEDIGEKSFIVSGDSLDYLENSDYPCHFIVNRLYWYDCAGLPNPRVEKVDAQNYLITYDQDQESITTDSLGGLNYASATYNFTLDTTAPTVLKHKSVATSVDIAFYFNTSEITNYTYGVGSSDCQVHDKGTGSNNVFTLVHGIVQGGLHYNTTYYLNLSIYDQAGNKGKRCFLVNTSSAALVVKSVKLLADGGHFVGLANATHGTNSNISYECRFYVNRTNLQNVTYPTPQYVLNPNKYFQETANAYADQLTYPWNHLPQAFDGDYSTYAQAQGYNRGATVLVTYYKPVGYNKMPILWQIKDTAANTKVNLTLPTECQPESLSYVRTRIYQKFTSPAGNFVKWQCCHNAACDDSGVITDLRTSTSSSLTDAVPYEEGFYWTVNSTVLHTTVPGIERNVGNITPTRPGTYYLACRITDGFVNSSWVNTTGLSIPAFNLTIKNEDTLATITGVNFSVDILSDEINYSNTFYTANGFLNFSLLPVLGNYTLRYYAPGYNMRVTSIDLRGSIIDDVLVYAIPNIDSAALDVYVRDANYLGIPNVTVGLLRFYANLSSWIEVSREQTSDNGKVRFYVNPGNAYYKFIVSYKGAVIFESVGEKILDSTYIITTSITPIYETYESIDAQIEVVNSSIPYYFKLAYSNKAEKIASVCMDTYLSTDGGQSLYNSTCLTSASGIIIHPFNESKRFTAYAYTTYTHSPNIYFAQAVYSSVAAFFDGFDEMKTVGVVLSIILFVVLVVGSLYLTGNPIVTIFAVDIALLAIRFLHLFNLSDIALGIIIPGSLVIAYYLNKVTY